MSAAGRFVQCRHFSRQRGRRLFRYEGLHFAKKTLDFSHFMVCPHRQTEGLSQCRQGGRESIFYDFMCTFFMSSLWNKKVNQACLLK